MTKREDTIQMSVGGLTLDPVTKTPIVILKDTENKLNLPIWIGLLEATAMATEIEGIKMARPMTHDLLKNILGEVGCSVDSVEITELKENTYYAMVHLKLSGRDLQIDSRPSDAIADRGLRPCAVAARDLRVQPCACSPWGDLGSRQAREVGLHYARGRVDRRASSVLATLSGGRMNQQWTRCENQRARRQPANGYTKGACSNVG